MSPKLVNLILRNVKILETLALPATFLIGLYMSFFTRVPPIYLRRSYNWFAKCNWLPVLFHYYQPVVKLDMLPKNYDHIENQLTGIDLNTDKQLDLLSKFHYNEELERITINKINETAPYYNNINFQYGDAEIFYNMIRYFKPKRIIEIGSGESTKFAQLAIEKNKQETAIETQHICIEPFEQSVPTALPLTLIRERVEHLDPSIFKDLSQNDILFIDSSHVIRPGGDVLFEYLNIIPSLGNGVIVHCHDIFLPREYPLKWVDGWKRFWNEQYLLQALISHSPRYQVLLSLNYLTHHYEQNFEKCCPVFKREKHNAKEPSSFWFHVVQ